MCAALLGMTLNRLPRLVQATLPCAAVTLAAAPLAMCRPNQQPASWRYYSQQLSNRGLTEAHHARLRFVEQLNKGVRQALHANACPGSTQEKAEE